MTPLLIWLCLGWHSLSTRPALPPYSAQVSTQAIAQGTKSRVSTSSPVAFPQQSTNAPISEVRCGASADGLFRRYCTYSTLFVSWSFVCSRQDRFSVGCCVAFVCHGGCFLVALLVLPAEGNHPPPDPGLRKTRPTKFPRRALSLRVVSRCMYTILVFVFPDVYTAVDGDGRCILHQPRRKHLARRDLTRRAVCFSSPRKIKHNTKYTPTATAGEGRSQARPENGRVLGPERFLLRHPEQDRLQAGEGGQGPPPGELDVRRVGLRSLPLVRGASVNAAPARPPPSSLSCTRER